MKKLTIVFLALILTLSLVGCAAANQQKITYPSNTGAPVVSTTAHVSMSATVSNTVPPTTTGWEVVELLVYLSTNGADLGMNSTFYEDENYVYYFYGRKSENIYVRYSNGTGENIKEALLSGRATIADLDRLEIEYRVHPKNNEQMH